MAQEFSELATQLTRVNLEAVEYIDGQDSKYRILIIYLANPATSLNCKFFSNRNLWKSGIYFKYTNSQRIET